MAVHQLHAYDCGDYLEHQPWMEIGAEQVRQEEERAQQLFPDAVARFHVALQALPAERGDSPFVKALVELVTLRHHADAELLIERFQQGEDVSEIVQCVRRRRRDRR